MNAERRFEALAAAPLGPLQALADEVLATGTPVEVVEGPEVVTAPLRLPVPGTDATTAAIGHVALTRCRVELGSVRGDGHRRGRDLLGAVAAAICDAEAERGGPLASAVEELAAESAAETRARSRERARQVALTRMEGG